MEQYPIGCLLKMITDKIKIQADANLAQHDLTLTQSRVLGYLARNGGTATQKEIEGFLQVSHPTVAGVIGRMEQKGFVSCRPDPADKRSKLVCQTPRATEIAHQVDLSQFVRSAPRDAHQMLQELEDTLRTIYADLG